jgi:hypothetical protein
MSFKVELIDSFDGRQELGTRLETKVEALRYGYDRLRQTADTGFDGFRIIETTDAVNATFKMGRLTEISKEYHYENHKVWGRSPSTKLYKVFVDGHYAASYVALSSSDAVTKAKEAVRRGLLPNFTGMNFTAEVW